MDRRRLLQSLAAGLTVTVAGCGGDSDTLTETSDSSPAPTETTGQMDTPTPTAESTATPDGTATPTPDETATPTPEGTATPTPDSTQTPEPTPTPTPTPVAQTVDVGAGGGFNFAPESFTVAVGDTVEWTWVSSNHNVTANSVPGASDWSGTPDSPNRTFEEGYSYQYTFEVAGEYTYYCAPHRSAGMTGSFTVTE